MSKHNHNHHENGIKPDLPDGHGSDGVQGNAGEGGQENPAGSGENAQAGSPSPGAEGAEPKMTSIEAELVNQEQKIMELEAKLADANDQYLRKAADFENFRKRTIREKQELSDFSNQNLLLDLLPVIDDFERAIKSAETSKDFASFYDGIKMIEKGLSTQLESKWGLKRFDSEGEPFDPNRHEALQMEKSASVTEALVKDDFVKGYLLKDRVLRYAKVKVLVPENEEKPPEGNPAEPSN